MSRRIESLEVDLLIALQNDKSHIKRLSEN
jgi:hypothetical protein